MRWLVVVLAIVVAGCQSGGNYIYPPGQSPAGAASRSHAKMPPPKPGDSTAAATPGERSP